MHQRWTGARGDDAELLEDFTAELLGQSGGVLQGVVQMDLRQPVKILASLELVEVKRQRWFGVDPLEAEASLKVDGDVGVNALAVANGALHVDALGPRLTPDLVVLS